MKEESKSKSVYKFQKHSAYWGAYLATFLVKH